MYFVLEMVFQCILLNSGGSYIHFPYLFISQNNDSDRKNNHYINNYYVTPVKNEGIWMTDKSSKWQMVTKKIQFHHRSQEKHEFFRGLQNNTNFVKGTRTNANFVQVPSKKKKKANFFKRLQMANFIQRLRKSKFHWKITEDARC